MSSACRYRCAVVGCTGEEGDQRNFHYLPVDSERRKAWLKLMGLPTYAPKHSKIAICGRHFTSDDYMRRPDVVQGLGLGAQYRNLLLRNAVPSLFLPISPPQHSEIQGTEGAVASDGSGNKLPRVSKCYCSCHPETSTKFVQTYSRGVQRQSTTSTQTDVSITQTCVPSMLTYVTKVVNTCRCSCHCVMSTAAVQTTPIARCTCCAQTDDSFLYAKATHVDAGLQVCLDATICVTVRVQTDPKPPVVPCQPVVEDPPRPVKGSRRGAKGSCRGAKGSRRGAKGSRRRVVKRRK